MMFSEHVHHSGITFYFDSRRLKPHEQGSYNPLENAISLHPMSSFSESIQLYREQIESCLAANSLYPIDDDSLPRLLRISGSYTDALLKNSSMMHTRWQSACAHEIAHSLLSNAIPNYNKQFSLTVNGLKESGMLTDFQRRSRKLQGLEELNSTLFELSVMKDPGAVYILLPGLYERVFLNVYGDHNQGRRIERIIDGEHIYNSLQKKNTDIFESDYNLATLDLFCCELLGVQAIPTSESVYTTLKQQLKELANDPQSFINRRVEWYQSIHDDIVRESTRLVSSILR